MNDPTDNVIRAYFRHRRPRTIAQHVEAALGPESSPILSGLTMEQRAAIWAGGMSQVPFWRRWWEWLK